jgi:hypothetical protein
MKPQAKRTKTLLQVGFESGIEAAEEPDAFEMSKYKQDYVLGFVVGRSLAQIVQTADRSAGALLAGELGVRYGVSRDALLAELEFPQEFKILLSNSYDGTKAGSVE